MIATVAPDETELRAAHRARVERHMAALAELTELGMGIARVQGARVLAANEAETEEAGAALMFARVSSVVRLSIALEARLSAGLIVSLKEDEESPQAVFARIAEGAAERLRARVRAMAQPQPGEEGYEEWVAGGCEELDEDWDGKAFSLDGGRLDGGVSARVGVMGAGDGAGAEGGGDGDSAVLRSSPHPRAFTPTQPCPIDGEGYSGARQTASILRPSGSSTKPP